MHTACCMLNYAYIPNIQDLLKCSNFFHQLHTYPSDYNMDDFYKNVLPRSGLPSNFGGELASVDELHEQFKSEYYNLRDYFRAEEEQRGFYWDKLNNNKNKKKANDEPVIRNFQKLDID